MIGIDERRERQPIVGRAGEQLVVRRTSWPSAAQSRRHACSSHSPPMFFSSRVVPHDAALVREVERRALSRVMTGGRQLGAEQRPRAGAEERALPAGRDRRHRRRRCRGRPARRPACRRARADASPADRADHRARLDERRQQARRQADLRRADAWPTSASSRVDELGRRRHGVLGAQHGRSASSSAGRES